MPGWWDVKYYLRCINILYTNIKQNGLLLRSEQSWNINVQKLKTAVGIASYQDGTHK